MLQRVLADYDVERADVSHIADVSNDVRLAARRYVQTSLLEWLFDRPCNFIGTATSIKHALHKLPDEISCVIVVSDFHTCVDCASVTIAARIVPEIQVLSPDTIAPCLCLEPRLAQLRIFEHREPPQRKAHADARTFLHTILSGDLRAKVHVWSRRIAPYLWSPALSFRPVKSRDRAELWMLLHALSQHQHAIWWRHIVSLDGQNVFPVADCRIENRFHAL